MQHIDESHRIFDRVTMLEANVTGLTDSVNRLATTVQSTEAAVGEIKTMIGAVGKTDGKTILTLAGSVIGALAIIGTMFLGPIQRDVSYINRQLEHDEHEIRLAVTRYDDIAQRAVALRGEIDLLEWRLNALEEKQ
jgi:hypothetical protein